MQRRLKLRLVFVPFFVYCLLGLPAVVAGRPPSDVLLHYLHQSNLPGLTLGAPNWYEFVSVGDSQILWWLGVIIALMITIAFIFIFVRNYSPINFDSRLMSAALLSLLFMPYCLPGMHERYFFAADVFSLVYAFYCPRTWGIALLIQIASCFAYVPYLFKIEPIPRPYLAFAMTTALVAACIDFLQLRGASIRSYQAPGGDAAPCFRG
jgi:Gpi18-like mannosyltransferase